MSYLKTFIFVSLLGLNQGCGLVSKHHSERAPSSSFEKVSKGQSTCFDLSTPLMQPPSLSRESIQSTLKKQYSVDSRTLDHFYDKYQPRKSTSQGEHPFTDILLETPGNQRYLASSILYTLKERLPLHRPEEIVRQYKKLTTLCGV